MAKKPTILSEQKRITGMWIKEHIAESGKKRWCLKAGKLNHESFQNMQYWGENTTLVLVKNKRKNHKDSPDYILLSCPDFSQEYY